MWDFENGESAAALKEHFEFNESRGEPSWGRERLEPEALPQRPRSELEPKSGPAEFWFCFS
jgi:hypothetical protein